MQAKIIATGCILFSLMLPSEALAADFSKLYVFSDSISDTGNVFNATIVGNRLDPTISIDPPSPPYFDGRYSNGPVGVDYIASDLGLTLIPSAELAVGSPITVTPNGEFGVNFFFNGATTTQSVNFAFGGAQSGLENVSDSRLPGILREIQAFRDDLELFNQSADPNALYVVWAAGSNDYSSGTFREPTIPVENIARGVTSLYEAGARNILVPNVSDLGKTPLNLSRGPDISNALTQLSQAHNSNLAITLNDLEQTLAGVNIISLDVASLFQEAIANPTEFGFTNVTEPCLDPATSTICPNPNEYLFWDNVHPTAATHAVLGEFANSALKAEAVPEPSDKVGLVLGTITVGLLLRSKRQGKRFHGRK